MANILSRFITDRLITPAVQAQLPAVTEDTEAYAVGVSVAPAPNLHDTLGEATDSDDNLLYGMHRQHADVAAGVRRWAGGILRVAGGHARRDRWRSSSR
jgi:hypothetical protein